MRASDVYRIEYENLPILTRAARLVGPSVWAAMGAAVDPVWLKRAMVVRIADGEVIGTVENEPGSRRDMSLELETDLAALDVEAFEAEWGIARLFDVSTAD